jgi:hypothetical protein
LTYSNHCSNAVFSNASPGVTVCFLGVNIGVFWKRESRPIEWHQCHLSIRQFFVCTSIVYARIVLEATPIRPTVESASLQLDLYNFSLWGVLFEVALPNLWPTTLLRLGSTFFLENPRRLHLYEGALAFRLFTMKND